MWHGDTFAKDNSGPTQSELTLKSRAIYSDEEVLHSFFQDLLETTPAGYTLYGTKPLCLDGFVPLENTIVGNRDHQHTISTLLAIDVIEQLTQKDKNPPYRFLAYPENGQIAILNQEALNQAIEKNIILFKHKFGVDFTTGKYLENPYFFDALKNSPALQGIVLGYGVENSISYEKGKKLLQTLSAKESIIFPYQQSKAPTTEKETLEKYAILPQEVKQLTFYQHTDGDDRLKIPFSFHKNSAETLQLFQDYQKAQIKIDRLLSKKSFLRKVLKKLGITLPQQVAITSKDLAAFFTEDEKNYFRL